ncbi:MAG: serine/threonine protein kinase [Bacteroidetes bacterium]|nr:serine/threonine protein kinase [Bacteroidota bacterium]MCW5897112.1 serine/threonine protein kinase [Bacteroidota bacterium]
MQQSIIGKVIDNYEITGILGKGGMGVVYKAKDMTLDRDVALKMMDANFARDEDFLKRFKSEAKALAKLQNSNIVSVFALRETEIGFALVMEFVEGNTLADRIRMNGALPLNKTLPIFKQLLTALDHAHRLGIIHRDIKPGNVMLTPQDVVKVTDFGLAKIQQVSSATVTMGTGGTLYYMSPEQIRGLANVDARGDVYSLGMTLYETVTGRVPFGNNATDFDIRQMIVEGKIPPADKFNPSLPKEIVKAISKSLEKDPAKRFQSAAEMWDMLSRVDVGKAPAAEESTGQPILPAPNLKKQTSTRRPLYLTLGAGATLIAVLFALRPVLFPPDATLSVQSDPAGSKVMLNGKLVGTTPLKSLSVDPGKISVRVDREGYYVKDTSFMLSEGQVFGLSLALNKLPEQIVTEEKPGLTGEDRASTKDGALESETASIKPAREETQTSRPVDSKPVGFGTLQLAMVPDGSVSIDGSRSSIGKSGMSFQAAAGDRVVVFEHPQYGTKRTTIKVKPGETEALTCYFETYFSIVVQGDASGGMISVNGKTTDIFAPVARFPLGPGRHRVTVTRFGYETQGGEREVLVSPSFEEKTVPLTFTLKKEG